MARNKITVVGGGNVGASAMAWAAAAELGDLVLVDIVEGLPQGKALDMAEAGPVMGFDAKIVGANDYEATVGSDVVIITAGLARKPGMSRDDLIKKNTEIVGGVAKSVAKYSPDAFIIVVSNPLDAMCAVAKDASGFPRNRVIGMAGMLDSTRFRTFLAMELNVSVKDISAMVLGGHGDTMVPLTRFATVGAIPVESMIEPARLEEIVQRTRDGGAEIVKLLKTGSAFYAPAACAVDMARAILKDQKRVVPCAAYLEGEYGYKDIYLGVPVVLGAGGVENIIEVELNEAEKAALDNSAAAVRSLLDTIGL
jgi:malate dehydrogenase